MNYKLRREKLKNVLAKESVGSALIQNPDNIFYLTGFNAAVSSRPIGFFLTGEKNVLIVPRVAEDSARVEAQGVDISVYYEQPEHLPCGLSFQENLARELETSPPEGNIGVEAGKLTLSDLYFLERLGFSVQDISGKLNQLRSVKEPEELDAIRIAGHYVDFTQEKSLASIRVGTAELEIDQAGVFALNQEVASKLPGAVVSYFVMSTSGAERTVMPHVHSGVRRLQSGDSILLCRQVSINGYRAQCDRTAFLGKPDRERCKFNSLVLAAHEAAVEVIRPGISACQVDKAIRDVYEKAGVAKYFVHRSGHGFGINMAETPYLQFNNMDVIQENMVLVIQPALYMPGVGGFRHTDTVFVKAGGGEIITHCPRDLESLTFDVE